MFKDKFKSIIKTEDNNKKKIENVFFVLLILIVTIIIMNVILKDDSSSVKENDKNIESGIAKSVSTNIVNDEKQNIYSSDLELNLEKILSTIKGVGKVDVFINYSQSSQVVAMYDEKTTTSSTEETDSAGGVRNTISTETQKDVIYSDEDGNKTPVTEKVIMPSLEGAIITAQGASDVSVKANIICAVEAATGLSINKIQVFEMEQ